MTGAGFTKGRIKNKRDREVWDGGPAESLYFSPHTVVFILHVVRTGRGSYVSLPQSDFKPRLELTLRSNRDVLLIADLQRMMSFW